MMRKNDLEAILKTIEGNPLIILQDNCSENGFDSTEYFSILGGIEKNCVAIVDESHYHGGSLATFVYSQEEASKLTADELDNIEFRDDNVVVLYPTHTRKELFC